MFKDNFLINGLVSTRSYAENLGDIEDNRRYRIVRQVSSMCCGDDKLFRITIQLLNGI